MSTGVRIEGMDKFLARVTAVRKEAGAQKMTKPWATRCAALMEQKVGAMSMPWSGTSGGRWGGSQYRLRGSFKVKALRVRKGEFSAYGVTGSYHAYFVDHGVVAHSLKKRAAKQNRTVFAKKHHGYKARPFRAAAAVEALRDMSLLDDLVVAWNRAG